MTSAKCVSKLGSLCPKHKLPNFDTHEVFRGGKGARLGDPGSIWLLSPCIKDCPARLDVVLRLQRILIPESCNAKNKFLDCGGSEITSDVSNPMVNCPRKRQGRLPCHRLMGSTGLFRRCEVNVLAKAYQALGVVFRCRNPVSVVENPEVEGEAGPAEVALVAACLYSLDSAPGI